MTRITTEQLIATCMKEVLSTDGGKEQVKEFINWLSKAMVEKEVPLFIAITGFAIMAEGAAGMIDKVREAGDAIQ